jgi:hypothetical protein
MLELKKAQSKSTKLTSSSPMLRTNKNTNFFSFIYQTFAKWFNILWIKTGKLIWGCSTGIYIFNIFRFYYLSASIYPLLLDGCF